MVAEIDETTFEQEVLSAREPVLIDFHAPWCGPCRAMTSVIDELSRDLQGEAKVVKIDVDKSSSLAQLFEIGSIPTFAIFKDGSLKAQLVGARAKQDLLDALQQHLN